MTRRQPSRLALLVFDLFVPKNAALKGDLIEEFNEHQSQASLWWEVLGAAFCWRWHVGFRLREPVWIPLVGTALLLLVSFEVVFAANVFYRLVFGPPAQDIRGYLYLLDRVPPSPSVAWHIPLYRVVVALALSIPAGWYLARSSGYARGVALGVLVAGASLWTVVNLQTSFSAQFISMLALIAGFIVGGRLSASIDALSVRSS